ncbi:MAG: hypothetical protein E7343_02760 [Clostridiales bacterium]|nr:hypothetical protein [Clostridiales bacterium]
MRSDKVAIYVRLSREDENKTCVQDTSKSIENQIFTLKMFAQEQRFQIYEIYIDDGYSGASFERPALKKMLTDMERKKFNIVLLKDLSRLGRSLRKVGEYLECVFPAHGIRVISLNDKYDSQSYKEDTSILFRGFLDEYYRKEFLKKCKQARIHYAQTKHLNYYPKYGYRYDENGTEIIDNYSASIVRRIYDYVANEGLSCGKIADKLNADGVLTRSAYATTVLGLKPLHKTSAKKWNAEKVWSIATDYEYCGHSINWSRLKENERIMLKDTHCSFLRLIVGFLFFTHSFIKKMASRAKRFILRKRTSKKERNADDGRTCFYLGERYIDFLVFAEFVANDFGYARRGARIYVRRVVGRFFKAQTERKFRVDGEAKNNLSSLGSVFGFRLRVASRINKNNFAFFKNGI